MDRKYHEAESIKLFNKPFTEVHVWLDGCCWKNGKFDPYHRRYRHTMEGVYTFKNKDDHDKIYIDFGVDMDNHDKFIILPQIPIDLVRDIKWSHELGGYYIND